MCAGNPGGPWSPPNELEPISAVAIPSTTIRLDNFVRCDPPGPPSRTGPLESEGVPNRSAGTPCRYGRPRQGARGRALAVVVQTVRGADALAMPKHWSGSVAAHQGERRWGIIGSPHRHALSELAGPARGGHVPPPRRLVGHHAVDRSHGADTRLTGSAQAGR